MSCRPTSICLACAREVVCLAWRLPGPLPTPVRAGCPRGVVAVAVLESRSTSSCWELCRQPDSLCQREGLTLTVPPSPRGHPMLPEELRKLKRCWQNVLEQRCLHLDLSQWQELEMKHQP